MKVQVVADNRLSYATELVAWKNQSVEQMVYNSINITNFNG